MYICTKRGGFVLLAVNERKVVSSTVSDRIVRFHSVKYIVFVVTELPLCVDSLLPIMFLSVEIVSWLNP